MTAGGPARRRREPGRTSEEGAAETRRGGGRGADAASRPDVYLDVPKLEVDHIGLEVENLRARVSLQAEVLDLLKLNVGVDAELGRVALEIDGVQAEATLKVRLDEVAGIIDRVLDTIDRNPQILETLAKTAQDAVQEVGSGVGEAASQVGQAAGDAVGEVAGQAGGAVGQLTEHAGSAVEEVTDQAGGAVGDAVGEVTDQAGDAVGEVTDQAGEAVGQATGEVAEAGSEESSSDGSSDGSTDAAENAGDDPVPSDDATPARVGGSAGRSRRSPSTTKPRPARRATG